MTKIMKKPAKPERKVTYKDIYLSNGNSTLGYLKKEVTKLCSEYGEDNEILYDCDDNAYISIRQPEPEESFNKRLAEYEEKQLEYEQWIQDNQEVIEEQEKKKREAARKRIERERAKLLKRLQQLEKQEEKQGL